METLDELVTARRPAPQLLVYGPGSEAMAEQLSAFLGGSGHVPRRRRFAEPGAALRTEKNAIATAARRWPAAPVWDIVVQVRDSGKPDETDTRHPGHPPDVVVDNRDPQRPVIRHVAPDPPVTDAVRIHEIQIFFAGAARHLRRRGRAVPRGSRTGLTVLLAHQ